MKQSNTARKVGTHFILGSALSLLSLHAALYLLMCYHLYGKLASQKAQIAFCVNPLLVTFSDIIGKSL